MTNLVDGEHGIGVKADVTVGAGVDEGVAEALVRPPGVRGHVLQGKQIQNPIPFIFMGEYSIVVTHWRTHPEIERSKPRRCLDPNGQHTLHTAYY